MSGARRWIFAGSLAAGLALAPGAVAAPSPTTPSPTTPGPTTPSTVGQHHDDTGSAAVRGTDGLTYQVWFELDATTGNPSQGAVVTVQYKACKRSGSCGFTYTYGITLSAGQVSFPDANSASVAATLLGKPLHLQWTAHPSATAASVSVHSDDSDVVAVGDPSSGGAADFTATFFGMSCAGNGDVQNEYGVFSAPEAPSSSSSKRLPAGFGTKRGHKPACQSQ